MSSNHNQLGLWTATSLVIGNMIGSGIFLLPSVLAAYGGISVLGWLCSAIGAILLALVFSQLSKIVPKTGGPYIYTHAALGDFPAFLVAWGYWISILCTNAAITVALVSYTSVFAPILENNPVFSIGFGWAIIGLLTWLNTQGIKKVGILQLATTILKITPLILIAIIGLFYIQLEHFSPFNISEDSHFSAITATATLTLFAFLGMESATIPAGSIKNAEKTIPKATMLGTVVVIVIYILSSTVVMGLIPPTDLQHSNAPFADAAALMWGDWARYLVAIGAIISTFGALNGWLLMQGQIPLAAAENQLFPSFFRKKNKQDAPALGILISSVLVSILMMMNFVKGLVKTFEFAILLATFTALVPYLFSTTSYVLLSFQKKYAAIKTFLPPAVLGFLAFLFGLWAIIGAGQESVFWGFILLMGGIPFYVGMKK